MPGDARAEEIMDDAFVAVVGHMLLLCDSGSCPSKPFFTGLVIQSAIGSYTRGRDQAAKQAHTWEVRSAS